MNVATDVARCRHCSEIFALSELIQANSSVPIDLDHPPRGAWYAPGVDGFVVGATTRNPVAFFLVPFMCVWSGLSLGGIYGTQIVTGRFNVLMSLFGIPFLLGTLVLGSVAVMSVCGHVVVRLSGSAGVVFTGVGPIGFRKHFDANEVTAVRVAPDLSGNRASAVLIVLDGPHRVRFGSGLTEARRDFIAGVLRSEMLNRKWPQRDAW